MNTIKIKSKDGSEYSISASSSGFVVKAAEAEDAGIAESAQLLIAGRWKRNAYSPAMGEPLAAAAAMAASIIGGKVVTKIPAGRGELEQAGESKTLTRAWCKGASPPDNSCPPSNKGKGGKGSGGGGAKGKNKGDKGGKGFGGGGAEAGGGSSGVGGDSSGGSGSSVEQARPGDGPLVKAARSEHKKALDKFRKGIETANTKAGEKHANAMKDHIASKENLGKQWDEVNRLAIEVDNLTVEAQADPKNEAKWQKVRDAGQALTQARVGLEPFERAEAAAKKSKEKAAEGVRTATAKAFAKEISAVDKEDGLTPKERKTISDAITRHNQRGESFAGTGFESEQMARSAYAAGVRGDGQAYLREHVNNSIHSSALQARIEYEDGVRANAAGGVLVRADGVEVGLVGTCKFDPTDSQRTFIHEFGHQIEHGNPEVRSLCEDFLRSRVGSESPKSLKELYPTAAYRDDERGLMDDFAKAHVAVGYDEGEAIRRAYYAGKDYSGVAGKNGLLGTTPTEILSMGMELMYRDAVAFSKADPEWFDLVSGVSTGRLLSKTRAKRKK
jgi:hypothetical protein